MACCESSTSGKADSRELLLFSLGRGRLRYSIFLIPAGSVRLRVGGWTGLASLKSSDILDGMIQKRTVFVLGAGASMPYGFPSGPDLRHEICTKTLMPGDERHKILMDMRHSYSDVEKCRIALSRSWASSIDMFIASRIDHAKVAKAAIALTIADYERDEELFFADPKGDWFRYLWRFLNNPNGESLPKDRVSFVTFNYDRTLEHSLANAIKYAKRVEDVTSDLLPEIVHVYGSLGKYPFQDISEPTREFMTPSDAENIKQSRDSIDVTYDKTPSSQFPAQAQDLLEHAEQVIFLGFGYDEDNLRVLRLLKDDSCLNGDCKVYGTAMDLNDQERIWVFSLLGRFDYTGAIDLSENNVDCLMFLRQHQKLFV